MKKIFSYGTSVRKSFFALSKTKRTVSIAALLLVVLVLLRLGGSGDTAVTALDERLRHVEVARVSQLSQNATPLSLLGTVTSRSEATIRAEASGKVVGVYKRLGDYVSAGTVIAEFENSSERAQVLQAEGAYDAAAAGKDIASINLGSSGVSLVETKTQAINVIKSSYTNLDDVIRTKTDTAWKNPQTRDAKLSVTVPDAKLIIELEEARVSIETMLRARDTKNQTLTIENDLMRELSAVEAEANIVKDYLDDLSLAFNRALADGNASQAAIDGYKANTAFARTQISGVISGIAGTRSALSGSISANQIAGKNASSLGENSSSATDAQIKSALGNLRGAQARLEKTIVRSPITGTINSLAIHTGDFVSPFSEIAIVANNGSLEVIAYATEEERAEIVVGAAVTIEDKFKGVLTRAANALDPKTKKLELRVAISSTGSGLVNGQSVSVTVSRLTKTDTTKNLPLAIPLSALKLTPNGARVFTVSSTGVLESHEVTTGTLQGAKIAITSGLTSDMEIVVDARGLKEGVIVVVK